MTSLVIIVFVALVAGTYYFIGGDPESSPADIPQAGDSLSQGGQSQGVIDSAWKEYSSQAYNIKFRYPAKYFLEAKEVGDGHRAHYRLVLMEDTEEHRLLRDGKLPGREGPPTISIDFFQNNLDKLEAEQWIRGSNDSNFKLSNGSLARASAGGKEGFAYHWSGLYEGDSIVVSRPDNIIMFSVTYLTPEDEIRQDATAILQSLSL